MHAHDLRWTHTHSGGTHVRGYLDPPWPFEETVARLLTLTGQMGTCFEVDHYKVSVCFAGTFRGEVFKLYDYKEDRQIHIGGRDELDVQALAAALLHALETVTPMPYAAAEYYDVCDGHGYGL